MTTMALRFHGVHAPARQVFMSAALDLAARSKGPLSILEIGSDQGASLLTWAGAVERLGIEDARVLCVDEWADAEALAAFQRVAKNCSRRIFVEAIQGLSRDVLPLLADAAFNLVYIDGGHGYTVVAADIAHAIRLVRDGGLVCGDDLEIQLPDCDLGFAAANRDQDFVRDGAAAKYHPGVTLAVHSRFGRVSSFDGFWIVRKQGAEFANVSLSESRGVLPRHWPIKVVAELRSRFLESGELADVLG